MTRKEQKWLAALDRRIAHLAERTRDRSDLTYDLRELAALKWAVWELRRWIALNEMEQD